MDRITKSLLEEFVSQNSLERLPEDKAFEHFTSSLIVGIHVSDDVNSSDIVVGAGGDGGIDAIAVVVNGALVTEPEEIDDLIEVNGYLDVTFIFVQSERSPSFETAKIGQFSFGVEDFFKETPNLTLNSKVKECHSISKAIFSKSKYFKKGNPQCFLYYATTGHWTDDPSLTTRKNAAQQDIETTRLFRLVEFHCLGADQIQELYRKSQNAITCEITFSKRVVIPEMKGVEEAYLGILPALEFIKLIETETGEIRSSLFYDNVRHWQEWNAVNEEIKETLDNISTRCYLPLLNNGITIVAERVNPTGDKFLIEDYQIVNGCQSSHVLHACKDRLSDDIFVPVRLIATEDESVRNSIIKATNRQTEVTDDQFFALSEFPKRLEQYFPSFPGTQKLYYERRSRQYNKIEGIEKVRIINMTTLVRAFASIFRDLPHKTTRNYKGLLKEVGSEIFGKDHRLEPYYISAYASYRLEFLFRGGYLASELKPARYHILYASRLILNRNSLPRMNSHEMKRYCEEILPLFWDDDRSKELFIRAAGIIVEVANGNLDRDNVRTEAFTGAVKRYFFGDV